MRAKFSKVVLGLMLAALLVPTMGSDGCRRGYGGSFTDIAFGVDVLPSFGFSDWGFSDSYYEESYYNDSYYDDGFYDDGFYDDGFYDDGFYGDDFKAKNAGRKK